MSRDPSLAALFAAAALAGGRGVTLSRALGVVSHFRLPSDRSKEAAEESLVQAFREAGQSLAARPKPASLEVERAWRKADQWLESGVFAVQRSEAAPPVSREERSPQILFGWGERSLLEKPGTAILNSRPSRRTRPDEPWIGATKNLFGAIDHTKWAVVTSSGYLPYLLVSFLAFRSSVPQIVVCDGALPWMVSAAAGEAFLEERQGLFGKRGAVFVSAFPPGISVPRRIRFTLRDTLVGAVASRILVASMRRGGNIQRVVSTALDEGKPVAFSNKAFTPPMGSEDAGATAMSQAADRADAEAPGMKPAPRCSGSGARRRRRAWEALRLREWPERGSYLFHFTRSCPGPWPGQTMFNYCRSLVDGEGNACHSAFDTLQRILTEQRIRASSRLIRGTAAVVSFTELLPSALADLRTWRAGLMRWSFEPYGIGVRKETLAAIGAERVVYGTEDAYQLLDGSRGHLFQLQRNGKPDWSREQEWRLLGDLSFGGLNPDDILVLVGALEEAWTIRDLFPYDTTLSGFQGNLTGRSRQA